VDPELLEEAEYKDLRTCDKNIAIDRALFLSFVPTNAFRQMKVAVQTRAWKNRVDVGGVFGKVFCLMTQREASSEADCWELMQ
jgi:hypothetical protein